MGAERTTAHSLAAMSMRRSCSQRSVYYSVPRLDPVMMTFMDKNGMGAASVPGSTAATARLINSRAAADSCRDAVSKLEAAFQRKQRAASTSTVGQVGPAAAGGTSTADNSRGAVDGETAAAQAGARDGKQGHASSTGGKAAFDVADILPVEGDPRRPPLWLSRGLLQAAVAVTITAIVWRCWPGVSWIFVDCVATLFIALAIEPVVRRFEAMGLNRRLATLLVMLGLAVLVGAFIALFGGMLVSQVADLLASLPSAYESLREWVNSLPTVTGNGGLQIPSLGEAVKKATEKATVDGGQAAVGLLGPIAGATARTASSLASGLLSIMIVVITAYYASAYDVEARRAISRFIRPAGQKRFQTVWLIVRSQVSGFLYSRGILAAVNAAALSVFLIILHAPYWLPLSIACGLISQFVPTVGTYLGGALPCLSALASLGWKQAVAVLVFIVVYQQVENLVLSPAVSQATLSLNPAVSLLAVMVGGSVAGALGAFLALPVASSVKAVISQYAVSHETAPALEAAGAGSTGDGDVGAGNDGSVDSGEDRSAAGSHVTSTGSAAHCDEGDAA